MIKNLGDMEFCNREKIRFLKGISYEFFLNIYLAKEYIFECKIINNFWS